MSMMRHDSTRSMLALIIISEALSFCISSMPSLVYLFITAPSAANPIPSMLFNELLFYDLISAFCNITPALLTRHTAISSFHIHRFIDFHYFPFLARRTINKIQMRALLQFQKDILFPLLALIRKIF